MAPISGLQAALNAELPEAAVRYLGRDDKRWIGLRDAVAQGRFTGVLFDNVRNIVFERVGQDATRALAEPSLAVGVHTSLCRSTTSLLSTPS